MAKAGGYQGINELKAAEEEASKLILDAKNKRKEVIQRAKEDANKELEEHKAKREKEFSEIEKSKLGGDSEKHLQEVKGKIDVKIDGMEKEYSQNSEKVIDFLVQEMTKVNLQVKASRKNRQV